MRTIQIGVTSVIRERIPHLKLGLLQASNVRVSKHCPEFETYFQTLSNYLHAHFAEQPLSSNTIVGHVRRMYRKIGWEPTRYRPSSEALARRILQGKPLYRIFNLVDLGNLVSARFHLPMGLYDRDQISGEILVDVGKAGEAYQGISKEEIHAEGKLILRDEKGIFGNPTADSRRTALTLETQNILAVFFTPPEVENRYLEQTLQTLGKYFKPYVQTLEQQIVTF